MQIVARLTLPWREPAAALAPFADEPWAMALVSGGGGPRGRWSYVLRAPEATLVVAPDAETDAFTALRDLAGEAAPSLADGPPFQGGLAGLAAYELGARAEGLTLARTGWPDLAVGRYPSLLAFDHDRREVVALGRGADVAAAEARAAQAAAWLDAPAPERLAGALSTGFESLDAPASYEAAVAEVVARIRDGELFQANIARRWAGRLANGARPIDVLQRLIAESPAPFAAYLRLEGRALVSNSPERFVSADVGGDLETRPIKGTRRRGATPAEDAAERAWLAASPKDRAENLMIVDLMRNDLSRVSSPGSVAAPQLFEVETFANVHHLVSTVTGRLAPGASSLDLLARAFPPGSITGAPKVQAMKLIAALEPPRGPYCGALFWAGFDGAFDSSVLIRTLAFEQSEGGWAFEARAGAGIVADSDPVAERLETEAKIAALQGALR
ncbi:MAG: anthranilate synthase component I family protein [Caulobacterales bacterium]|nr:anthranilate synthase component I family protein [Caulobacterales bacterium]